MAALAVDPSVARLAAVAGLAWWGGDLGAAGEGRWGGEGVHAGDALRPQQVGRPVGG